jgi:nitric oxide reductase subunit B
MDSHTLATPDALSPWWRRTVILIIVIGLGILSGLAALSYQDAPPIPDRVVDPAGATLFTGADIIGGQQVFLKYGLMENGTIWGHGAYLGPDFSAEYLHALALDTGELIAARDQHASVAALGPAARAAVDAQVAEVLRANRYDSQTRTLRFAEPEVLGFRQQIVRWTRYFQQPTASAGLPASYIHDPQQLQQLTAFFAWTAWASIARRPGQAYSYTNNFPYDPAAGNTPSSAALLWSALSLISLLA